VKLVETPDGWRKYRYGAGLGEPWRKWWMGEAQQNATLLFEAFLLAVTQDPVHLEHHPELVLPCRCKESAHLVGFKWFLPWSSTTGNHSDYTLSMYGNRSVPVLQSTYQIHIDALRVLKSLGTKFIWWRRDNIAASFASLENARASNVFHCREGDNCTRVAAVINKKESDFFVKRTKSERAWVTKRMQELDITPTIISYEECSKNNELCAMQLQEALGLEHPNPQLLSSSKVKKYVTIDNKV
jgi:hypothetical protein